MAPQATYGALSTECADEEPLSRRSQKVVRLTPSLGFAVLSACAAVFFVGREASVSTASYSHQEVFDVAARCGDGQFIGGCTKCSECKSFEYNQGGCTYFKDTTCSYCEVIEDCPRETLSCTTQYDQVCTDGACRCTDPIDQYTDIDIRVWKAKRMQLRSNCLAFDPNNPRTTGWKEGMPGVCAWPHTSGVRLNEETGRFEPVPREPQPPQESFATQERTKFEELDQETSRCYWGHDCAPCTVCKVGTYEVSQCHRECEGDECQVAGSRRVGTMQDTVCEPCTVCEKDHYVIQACTYNTDTVCASCELCQPGFFTKAGGTCNPGSIYEVGSPAVCEPCSECRREGDAWTAEDGTTGVIRPPIFGEDTAASVSRMQWVSQTCVNDGEGLPSADGQGSADDTKCTACTPCDPTGTNGSPPMHVAHQCGSGISYELGKDTVCIECGNEATVSGCELDRDGELALNEYGEPYGCEWWVRTPCKSEVMDPIDFQPCGTCTGPYYERETCGITRNTICEACADSTNADGERRAISHCAFSDHLCDQGERMPGEMNGYASSEVRCGYYPGEVSDDNDPRRAARFKALGINPVTAADMCGEGGVECTLDACEPGYLGPRCDYLRIFTGCGTHMKDMSEIRANGSRRTTDENGEEIDDEVQALAGHFIERTAKMGRNWYNDDGHVPGQSYKTTKEAIVNFSTALQGTGPDARNMRSFMVWCMDLCDEYPECTAFELDDGGDSYVSSGPLDPMAGGPAGDEANGLPAGVQADSVCRLYNGPSQPDDMVDRDCYINIRRQSEADVISNLKRRAEADGTLVDPLTGAPVLTSLLDFLDFGKDDNGTPDDANDDCEVACGGDGSDCASMVWCPSKQACINTTNEPCPTCTGEETTAVCSDGFSATQQACEMAHCSFNDSIEGTAGITTREGCLALCGAGENEEIVNQTAGRENPNVQISRVYSTEMERCKDVEGRRVCPLDSINRCVWYDAKDNAGAVLAATWTEATCDPSGCGPDFQWCYLEDTCMRSELLETSDSNEGQIKSPLGCNNGFRLSNNVGYDDTMWYAAGSGSELLFGAYTGGSLDIVNEPFFK